MTRLERKPEISNSQLVFELRNTAKALEELKGMKNTANLMRLAAERIELPSRIPTRAQRETDEAEEKHDGLMRASDNDR